MYLWSMAIGVILVIGGCTTQDPPYQEQVLKFEKRLLGVWINEEAGAEGEADRIVVRGRSVKFESGRIKGDARFGESANAYLIEISSSRIEREAHGDDAKMEFSGLLLDAGDPLFVLTGVQPRNHEFSLRMPYHIACRVRFEQDRLWLWKPRTTIAWLSGATALDSVHAGDAELPVPSVQELEDRAKSGSLVTFDIDRLLQVYKSHIRDDAFWDAKCAVFRRVGDPPP